MGEEIAVDNGRISEFQGFMTLNLDRVILHTAMHHSSTSSYIEILLKSNNLFVDGRMDVRTDVWTFETHFIRSTQEEKT